VTKNIAMPLLSFIKLGNSDFVFFINVKIFSRRSPKISFIHPKKRTFVVDIVSNIVFNKNIFRFFSYFAN
jgi:hypothetical protein